MGGGEVRKRFLNSAEKLDLREELIVVGLVLTVV